MVLCRNNGESLMVVVEYLETSMSKDLLHKFPDNSAFDFDYAQSSIWSPLLPPPVHDDGDSDEEENAVRRRCGMRKLSYEEEDGLLENTKKMTAKFKRKLSSVMCDYFRKYQKMKKRKRRSMDFSSVGSSHKLTPTSPTPRKGWIKLLKAASKHFKKKKKNTKREIPLP